MKVYGITGSIACGKSTVTNYLREHGYLVIDADRISREALTIDQGCIEKVDQLFHCVHGGIVDRKTLGKKVFHDAKAKKMLENIIHPYVISQLKEAIQENQDLPCLFLDIPLLYESHLEYLCDSIIVVYLDEKQQVKRLMERDHIDEEYASYASSTSTDIVTEYDPETAVGTIRVAKKDSDDPTETEEVTGMTVPTETTEIRKDSEGNITDLAISTSINEIKNGFSLTSENKKLHSISISDKKNPKDHWITLSAKESATELGIRLRNGNNKIIITLTENEKPLNIIKVSDTEKDVILTTSTDETCVINKAVQNISVDKDGKYSDKKTLGRKNQIILKDVNGSAPYLELEYVKDEVATTSASEKDEDAARNLETKNTKAGDSESKGAEAEKQKDPDEELYWIQPYGEENQEPIVITVYKK